MKDRLTHLTTALQSAESGSIEQSLLLDSIQELEARINQQKRVNLRSRISMVKYLRTKPFFAAVNFAAHNDSLLKDLCYRQLAEEEYRNVEISQHHRTEAEGDII